MTSKAIKAMLHGALAVGMMLAVASNAAAFLSSEIYACGQRCNTSCGADPNCRTANNGKCTLAQHITCTATIPTIGVGVEATAATTIDLNGNNITCTEVLPSSCNYNGARIVSSGCKITNTQAGGGVISGLFNNGVDCQSNANSTVSNITVNDGLVGIENCKIVASNVVGPSYQTGFGVNLGISTGGISNADAFTKNFISGRVIAIYHNGTTAINVSNNVIDTTDVDAYAIVLGSGHASTSGNADHNIFFGVGVDSSSTLFSIGGTDNVTSTGNFCDPNHPDCGNCVSSGHCESYSAPFSGNTP